MNTGPKNARRISGTAVPAHLRAYVETLGADRAIDFLLEFGGATFYLASDPKGNSEIAKWLGTEDNIKLVDRLHVQTTHSYVRVPTAKPWIASVLRARPMPISLIARKLHVTDVTVSRWLKPDDRQLRLF